MFAKKTRQESINQEARIIRFLSVVSLEAIFITVQSSAVLANCVENPGEQVIQIKINSCENIVAEKNVDVQQYAASLYDRKTLNRFYTGALVNADLLAIGKDNSRLTNIKPVHNIFMYPSMVKNPCKQLRKNTLTKKKAASTCCDAGKTGKCIFGGIFMWDLNGTSINVFQ
jgi:hypothetical protein